jgi:hypothetical protein
VFILNASPVGFFTRPHVNVGSVKPKQVTHVGMRQRMLIFRSSGPLHDAGCRWLSIRINELPITRKTDRIVSAPTTKINEQDVASAPADMRRELELARQRGQLLCGYILQKISDSEEGGTDFAPAVPFVTTFSGVVGASQTMKWLMGDKTDSLHFQYSFQSGRVRSSLMRSDIHCECQHLAA